MQTLIGVVGLVVALFSGAFLVAFVSELATGGDGQTSIGAYVFLITICALLAAGGAGLAWSRLWRAPGRPGHRAPPLGEAEREQRILDYAATTGGRVTLAEVAAHCNLSVDESRAALDKLVLQGVSEQLVSDRGVLVYTFPGFLSAEEKARASDV